MRAGTVARLGFAALIGMAASPVFARTATLSPTYPPAPVFAEPDADVAVGTGWYLRGDVSYGEDDRPKLSPLGFNHRSAGGYAAGGGVGYRFNSMLRVDVTGDYLQPIDYATQITTGGVTTRQQGSLNRYDGLVNGYLDIGTWYGVTPYVGAGLGFAVFDPSASVTVSDATGLSASQGGSPRGSTTFAWAAMAGLSYALTDAVTVDLGYRHLDLGRFGTSVGTSSYSRSFTRDDVKFGVRYAID
ncbi:outer membrane protein [Lichenihabitans psoromatis]|uniref:outer membrane protein n=1 Tax=Lichenihabitans psoromatis TaxID=2528642 RepID=UPI0010383017|nr:outer membrane beta-barrel protein [Lichenihabitans psoromatis]